MSDEKRLKRRFGWQFLPVAAPNLIFVCLIYFGFRKIGLEGMRHSSGVFLFLFVLANIIPAYVVQYVMKYRIYVDASSVSVAPLTQRNPLMRMRFDEIETVDLRPLSDLGNVPNARANPAAIVLYRKGWDGYELFALDPSRTNLLQFRNLVGLLYERRPGTFTENALRYLKGPKLMTPRENRQGELVW